MNTEKKLEHVKNALLSAVGDTYHYFTPAQKEDRYILWYETGTREMMWADNLMESQTFTGHAIYFTPEEYDPAIDKIQDAMNGAGIGFRLVAVEFDADTRYIAYIWEWEYGGY